MPDRSRKGAILFIVLGVLMVVAFLATVILRITSNQARLTHHQVTRIQASYASKAGMILAFEKLRLGVWTQDPVAIRYYCINGNVDSSVVCLETLNDPAIECGNKSTPCNVQIAIYPLTQPGIDGTARVEIKTDYAPTP